MFIDIVFFILIILAIFKGYSKGFIVALFSIFALLAGIAAAMKLSAAMAVYLGKNVNIGKHWMPVVSFLVVFIVVVVLVRLGAKLVEKTVDLVLLGWLNRIAGILMYVLLYTIVLSVLLFYASQVHIVGQDTLRASVTWPYIQPFGPWAMEGLGRLVPFFKNMFHDLQSFFGGVEGKLN
jgi:membrane protein required for colicin V production